MRTSLNNRSAGSHSPLGEGNSTTHRTRTENALGSRHRGATDFVHLHHSDAEVVAARYAKGAMDGGPRGSAAPATASLAAAQQQKPITVFRRAECKELCVGGGKNAVERT